MKRKYLVWKRELYFVLLHLNRTIGECLFKCNDNGCFNDDIQKCINKAKYYLEKVKKLNKELES